MKKEIQKRKDREKKQVTENMSKQEEGITLIALVITIIILIILAGVTINMVIGPDGLIKQAQRAKSDTLNAQVESDEKLNALEEEIEEATSKKATPGKKVEGENAIYTDNTGTAIIPVGFAVVTNPDTINNGLVISDVENDDMANSKKGNQFVWIPVSDYSKFHLIEGYSNGTLQNYLSRASNPSREAGATKEIGTPLAKNSTAGTKESIAMYKSVADNRGFYIARFEAGISGTTDNASLATKTATDGSVKPLSQKGVGVWNDIAWGGTTAVEATDGMQGNDNADGAVKVARSMYTKSDTCGATSTLCYGVQWDAVMNFIDSNYEKADGTLKSFVANSTGGWYSDVSGNKVTTTGYHAVKNIYDLGGNVREWTMEAYYTNGRVFRRRLLLQFCVWRSGI